MDIDVVPNNTQNRINISTPGFVPVAILTTPEFNANTVDIPTVRFGPPGAAGAPPRFFTFVDVDGDLDVDLRLRFRKSLTGFACGDTEGELTGDTLTGRPFVGSDAVMIRQIPPC